MRKIISKEDELKLRTAAIGHAVNISPNEFTHQYNLGGITQYPITNGKSTKVVLENADAIYNWLIEDCETTKDTFSKKYIPIENLNVSVRIRSILNSLKLKTIEELLEMGGRDLRKIRNFGNKSYHELREELIRVGAISSEDDF